MNIIYNANKLKEMITKKLKIEKKSFILPEDIGYRYVIAVLPNGEVLTVQSDANNKETEKTHEELIETELISKLNEIGYQVGAPIESTGTMHGYPYGVPMVRNHKIALIIGANIENHPNGGLNIYVVPEKITLEQYEILNSSNRYSNSYLHDTGNNFEKIGNISRDYITSRQM